MTNYKPANLIANTSIKNYQDVFDNQKNSPTINSIGRELGQKFSEGFIKAWLINLNEMLNLNKPMTESQINYTANYIINDKDLSRLQTVDIQLFSNQILSGQYGELYESLNPPKVLGFLSKYFNEARNAGSSINELKHLKHKQ